MIGFEIIDREYLPKPLNVIQQSVSNLEAGHKEALKLASELKATFANLDLNEAEDEWKQNKINEISSTISDNTVYGNAAYSLDELIEKQGNVFSDAGLLGRLNAQKDYKENLAKIEQAKIPDGMKEMFKEENPYYYNDKVDKDGNIIGGSKWTPKSTPVDSVDMFDLMKDAMQILSKDEGGYNNVTFLDANGQPTQDPTQSVNGEIYYDDSISYKKLGADKIKKAIKLAIQNRPGALDSIEQDRKYAIYKYNKKPQNENGSPVIDESITDKYGNIDTIDEFIEKRITPFASAAQVNNVVRNRNYGNAMKAYRAAQMNRENTQNIQQMVNEVVGGGHQVGVYEISNNAYVDADKYKTAANNTAVDIVSKLYKQAGLNLPKGFDSVEDILLLGKGGSNKSDIIRKVLKTAESKGVTLNDEDRSALFTSINSYFTHESIMKDLEKGLSKSDQESLRFGSSAVNELYKSGNSKWDDNIIKINNKIWSQADKLTINLDKKVYNKLLENLEINNISELGLTQEFDNNKVIININSANKNKLPKLVNDINKIKRGTGYYEFYNNNKKLFNGLSVLFSNKHSEFNTYVQDLGKNYDNGVKASEKVKTKTLDKKSYINIKGTTYGSLTEIIANNKVKSGELKQSEADAQKKNARERILRALSSDDLNAGLLMEVNPKKDDNVYKKPENKKDLVALLNNKILTDGKNVQIEFGVFEGVPQIGGNKQIATEGYFITFEHNKKKHKLYYGGGIDEGTGYSMAHDPNMIAQNVINTAKLEDNMFPLKDYDRTIGSASVRRGKRGGVIIEMGGYSKEVSEDQAKVFVKGLHTLENMKHMYSPRLSQDQLIIMNNSIADIALQIANMTDRDPVAINEQFIQYVSKQ